MQIEPTKTEDQRSIEIKSKMTATFNAKYADMIQFIMQIPFDQTLKAYAMKSIDEMAFWTTRGISNIEFKSPPIPVPGSLDANDSPSCATEAPQQAPEAQPQQ